MPTIIPEGQFQSPSQLNSLPCTASARFLQAIPEGVKIMRICQDSNNPALVEIDYQLMGVHLYEPHIDILEVDGVPVKVIEPPYAVGNAKNNPPKPISTNCQVLDGTVVFDFGKAIPNLLSARTIKFTLRMIGSLNPAAKALNFTPQTVTDTQLWTKGQLPSPIGMSYQNGYLTVEFEYGGNIDCSCNIQCTIPSGVQQNIEFCANQRQAVILNTGPLTGEPSNLVLTYNTAVGNTTQLNIQSLINVIPMKPSTSSLGNPTRAEIGILRKSATGRVLNDVEYQLWKYEDSETNARLLLDWNHRGWQYFTDTNVIKGRTYGYAVRYKGKYGDKSRMSSWSVVRIN